MASHKYDHTIPKQIDKHHHSHLSTASQLYHHCLPALLFSSSSTPHTHKTTTQPTSPLTLNSLLFPLHPQQRLNYISSPFPRSKRISLSPSPVTDPHICLHRNINKLILQLINITWLLINSKNNNQHNHHHCHNDNSNQ
ncbi:unnamed protein product [Linum tenue]|uniref:Uncharacterized protein n=1 Tax=Linum tenue TaxID=586396 RepID=A0AAV0MPA5_9ROSI|nr:unnamed protein product [Linum tenue]